MTYEQMELAPVHRDDPESSREAADRVRPKVGGQLRDVLDVIETYGRDDGVSNRQIQIGVCGGYRPGDPLWNKVPTRCRTLERKGLIELVVDADGKPVLRSHSTGGRFLVWRAL